MVQAKSNTSVSTTSTPIVDKSQQSAPIWPDGRVTCALAPFRWAGDDLGLGNPGAPLINFVDAAGVYFGTHSIEWILREIHRFPDARDQCRLLAGAALHYGLDPHALMGADLDNMSRWDVCDASGRVLQAGLTHKAAQAIGDEYLQNGASEIRFKRATPGVEGDPRHEGPLVLLHHNLGVTDFTGIAVKSHVGRCGMMLEEVLWRFDQFSAADQALLLAGLAKHFDLCAAAPAQQGATA